MLGVADNTKKTTKTMGVLLRFRAVSEEFHTGGGNFQSPRPVPFSRLLRHTENTLALFL